MTHPILAQAKRLSTKLGNIVQAKRNLDALGTRTTPTAPDDGFIYEVYVDLRILFELRKSKKWTIVMQNETANELRLPRKPAKKASVPYFAAINSRNQELFQICFGTKYTDAAKLETFAPDISFQVPKSPLAPTADHIVFCIDQKYTSNTSKTSARLDREEVFKLHGKLASLLRPTGTLTTIIFSDSSTFVNRNSIVTNANESTLKTQSLSKMEITEISRFVPGQSGTARG